MSRWIGVLALVAFGCGACGGDAPQTPAGPSTAALASPGASSVTQGAKILGNVSAGAPLAAMAAQVVGTPISAPVGAGGGFSLEGVPEGDVQLRFVGSGVDASVALNPVRPGDVVSLLVGVAGATAMVQSESRNAGGKVELEGRVESLTAPDTLVVAGRTVTTTAETAIRDSNDGIKAFENLAIGQRVHVKGTLGADGIIADSILIQNTITTIPVNVNGVVESLSGTEGDFSFLIGSREIQGDASTVFYGEDGVLLTFAALVNGARVEVKGEMGDGFVYAVRIHINGPMEPPQDDSASVEGVLDVLAGDDPILTLTLLTKFGAVIVTTTEDTIVQRRGDVQTLDELKVGQTIHAVGTRLADANKTLVARLLQIKDDATDGLFTIEGSLGGLKGACPAISFGVNGYSIFTTEIDAVAYLPAGTACADLKNGMKVEVEGLRQATGSVKATQITKK
ncbi:MAG: DUF5666 domain-containing protein [Vicinamibacterales bacterium]